MRQLSRYYFFIVFLLLPQIALAHSPIKGIGYFLNGVLHPLFAPEQVITIVGLGLWYGQHQPNQNKKTMLYFMLAMIAGLLVGDFFRDWDKSLLLLISSIVISFFTITNLLQNRHFYFVFFSIFALIAGFLLGLDSIQETLSGKAKLVTLFGSGVGIYFLMLYAMAFSETFSTQPWRVIAVRILASWLSASALMVLALGMSQ